MNFSDTRFSLAKALHHINNAQMKEKNKNEYSTLKDLFSQLDEEANELINFGNLNEKSKGYGMIKVTKSIYEYCKKNKIIIWK